MVECELAKLSRAIFWFDFGSCSSLKVIARYGTKPCASIGGWNGTVWHKINCRMTGAVSLRNVIDALVSPCCGKYILVTSKFCWFWLFFRGIRQESGRSVMCSYFKVYGRKDIMRVWCAFLRALLGCSLHLVVIC